MQIDITKPLFGVIVFGVWTILLFWWCKRLEERAAQQEKRAKEQAEAWVRLAQADKRLAQKIVQDRPVVDYLLIPAGEEGESLVVGEAYKACVQWQSRVGRN